MQLPSAQRSSSAKTRDADLCRRVSAYTQEDAGTFPRLLPISSNVVPEMISDLIRAIIEVKPSTKAIYDPFAGSGTVMTEAMLQGRDFLARDINPLAVLLCKVKRGPFFPGAMSRKGEGAFRARKKRQKKDRSRFRFLAGPNGSRRMLLVELSRIRSEIESEPTLWARRFFWISSRAETVRTSSNSRTSTFKLHIRSEAEWETREVKPNETFTSVLNDNLESLGALSAELLNMSTCTGATTMATWWCSTMTRASSSRTVRLFTTFSSRRRPTAIMSRRCPTVQKRLGAEIGFLSVLHTWGHSVPTFIASCRARDHRRITLSGFARPIASSCRNVLSRVFRAKFVGVETCLPPGQACVL